jgi:hypothetical protein
LQLDGDVDVDWVEQTPSGKLSNRLPATGIVFRETTADYENSWHRAPRRQYVISLAGGISITASDGETRHIGAGEVVLVEDTKGPHHQIVGRRTAPHDLGARSIDRGGGRWLPARAGTQLIGRAGRCRLGVPGDGCAGS